MDMGSRRMQIVGIVLAVLMAALLAVTLWVYRPVSLAEAADARTGLEPKVVVVVRLDEMDGNGTSHEYQAYDPACWSRWSCWWIPPGSVWSGGVHPPPWTACVRSSSSGG